jgi:hypothetical protein
MQHLKINNLTFKYTNIENYIKNMDIDSILD